MHDINKIKLYLSNISVKTSYLHVTYILHVNHHSVKNPENSDIKMQIYHQDYIFVKNGHQIQNQRRQIAYKQVKGLSKIFEQ